MFCVSVIFEIVPDKVAAFRERVALQALQSVEREPACQVFEVWTAKDRPNAVHLHEVYDDAAAFETHKAADHYAAFSKDIDGMVADKTVTLWDARG